MNVATVTAEPDAGLGAAAAVLVRPDGYVAWVAGGAEDLPAALGRWFGAPTGSAAP